MMVYAATRDRITLDQNQTQRRAPPHQGHAGLSLSGIYQPSYTQRRSSVSAGRHGRRPWATQSDIPGGMF